MNEFPCSPALMDAQAFAVRLAIAGVGVCALVLSVARILRRRAEPLQYGVLFGGVIALLAAPALVALGQCLSVPTAPAQDEVLKVPVEMLTDLLNRPDAPSRQAEAPALAAPLAVSVFALAWTLGCAFGITRLTHAFWKQNRAFIRQPWQAAFWTDALQARLARQLGLKRFPKVDVSPAVPMPMVIGIWRPTIILPASSPASWGQAQWEAVLLHEAAHIARRDHWAALAQRCAVLLFWWCPLVYPLARRLNELRENICDDYALQGPCDPIAYAELLIESAERLVSLKSAPISLALLDSARGGLEARITRLLAKEKRTMTKLSFAGKLLGVAFLAAAGVLTMAATAYSGGGAQPTPKKVQIKIIIDGKEIDITDGKLLEALIPGQKKAAVQEAPKAVARTIQINEGNFNLPMVVAPPAQTDPRIEALVKQAEAIKPGSGADIRKALQGAPKQGEVRSVQITGNGKMIWRLTPEPKTPAVPAKKVIILQIEGAKAKPANEPDLKKLLEKGLQFELQLENPVPVPTPKAKAPAKKEAAQFHFEFAPATPKKTPAAPDLDALRRQLDRLTADVNALRKQLEAGSKQ